MLGKYKGIVPKGDLILLQRLGEIFQNKSFLHINSTREGGGVAEILSSMMPVLQELGIDARWEVIEGDREFFHITKMIHNALHGKHEVITDDMWEYYYAVNRKNAEKLDLDADAVTIHDPQPFPLVDFRNTGRWLWRCHIDVSNPIEEVCYHLVRYCEKYDVAVFSMPKFARPVNIGEFIIPPSIDPISEKNRELSEEEIIETMERFQIPLDRPIILQVSRFDRFKDPIGVINAYKMVKSYNDCILILAGSPATDDPEGEIVLKEVKEYAANDPDIYILLLSPFSDREINALQRSATVVMQKSLKEGFGLTVSEAMWKGKPVIGGATGGIPRQILHGFNGFLVHTSEGAAFRIRQFLNNREMLKRMGENGKEYVQANFLITRQLRDYLSLWYSMEHDGKYVFEL